MRLLTLMEVALLLGAAATAGPAAGLTATPTATPPPTETVTCAPTATPYCADHCEPCPTVRAGCYAEACGECHENPICGAGEVCEPMGLGGCCLCVATTPSPTPSPTPVPASPTAIVCDGDCDGDGRVSIDEIVAAVNEALGAASAERCASFDRDGNGEVSIDELVALVRTALDGCPETLFDGVDGVYDADGTQSTGGEPTLRSALAVVRRDGAGVHFDLAFDVLETLSVSARPGGGTVALSGNGVEGGDIVVSASGTATVTRADDVVRFAMEIDVGSYITGMRHLSLTVERPRGGTPESFSGAYRLQLHHDERATGAPFDSHVDLSIAAPSTGLAECSASSDIRDDDGTVLAELAATPCRVSPRGRFAYSTWYGGAQAPLQMFGNLRAGGGQSTGGTLWIAAFPFVLEHGTWDVVGAPP